MIHFLQQDILAMERLPRLKLINSITGYKPGNLIATINGQGQTNVAIFSSVVHIGSDPALLGFFMRPMVTERHTMENILETGMYTINHINSEIIEQAHFTSADFERHESEFDKCHLTPVFKDGFLPPYVSESNVQIGMELAEKVDIKLNNTILVIGYVSHLYIEQDAFIMDSGLDLKKADTVCISGLDSYHSVEKIVSFPFARTINLPDFGNR
jgi:flavin reductase (DIM6/NTAB) family NADH-FMN oxidoreductase RutF